MGRRYDTGLMPAPTQSRTVHSRTNENIYFKNGIVRNDNILIIIKMEYFEHQNTKKTLK